MWSFFSPHTTRRFPSSSNQALRHCFLYLVLVAAIFVLGFFYCKPFVLSLIPSRLLSSSPPHTTTDGLFSVSGSKALLRCVVFFLFRISVRRDPFYSPPSPHARADLPYSQTSPIPLRLDNTPPHHIAVVSCLSFSPIFQRS